MNSPHEPDGRSSAGEPRRGAMSSPAAERVYGQHSGYRKLKAYQVAELLYDFTCRFCDRYVPKNDRHHDQMVQAARSGYQNIAEGSEDSATSKKLEMNLTNVARASIDEARKDYIKHLIRRGLRHWQDGEPLFTEARNLRPKTLVEAADWVNQRGAEGTAGKSAPPTWAQSSPRRRIGSPSVCWIGKRRTSKAGVASPNGFTAHGRENRPAPFRPMSP